MPRKKLGRVVAAIAAGALLTTGLTACSSSDSAQETFTIWQFEDETSAQYQSWQTALDVFRAPHPDVDVEVVTTSFDSIRQNAKVLLGGSDAPDVVEINKGSADAGELVAQGLLEDLSSQVEQYGWDDIITGSMQDLAKYESDGSAGSGSWYGIPNSGQYYVMYYNADMFADAGIAIPTTSDELVDAMKEFLAQGITPVSSNAGEYGLAQLWYQLVSNDATRTDIDNYQYQAGSTDFTSGIWANASAELQSWIDAGYLGDQLGAVTQSDMENSFISGEYPIMFNGSWAFSKVSSSADFDFGTISYPGASLTEGLTGQLWAVPTNSAQKDLAYDWINTTLGVEAQNKLGELGGLPLRSDLDPIEDEQIAAFTDAFNALKEDDTLSSFPDYPVTGLLEFLESEFQSMANGNLSSTDFDSAMQTFYDGGGSSE